MRPFLNLLAACVLALATLTAHAAEKRVALVVGNSAYPTSRLDNPKNDATVMAATFRRLGFEVDLLIDAGRADFDSALKRYAAKADKADAAVLFYAGHGMQANGHNYLVPIDANPQSERDLKREMIKLDDIIDDMGNARVKLVFFDACRDNPLARTFSRGGARGMAAPAEATGTLISFATKHGNTASDGDGKHSPYTEALLAALEKPTEEVHALLRRKVQEAVKKKTRGQQEPWSYGNLNGDFYFIFTGNTTVNVQAPDTAPRLKTDAEIEQELWDSIKHADSADALNEYLKAYPKGRYLAQARILLAKLKKDGKAEPVKPATVVPAAPAAGSPEDALWTAVERGNSADDYDAYLSQYPSGKYAVLAKNRKQKLEGQVQREAIQREQEAWSTAETSNSEDSYAAYLKAYPSGQHAQLAQARIRKLQVDDVQSEADSEWKQVLAKATRAAAVQSYLEKRPTKLEELKTLARKGNAGAQGNLARMYVNGWGVTKDYTEALFWARKATEQGNSDGQVAFGFCLENGFGVARDQVEAVKWYRKAAEQGNAKAQVNLAAAYLQGKGGLAKDEMAAFELYRKAAEQGDVWGQYGLGYAYANGRGVAQDYEEARKWYRKSADQGLAEAQNNLGDLYFNGYGVSKDHAEAAKWFRMAADQGLAMAQRNLSKVSWW